MKRGKDNGFQEKGGPPGYVPLTLHQLGIGLTYYDEQRPLPQRGRPDSRRSDGNSGRYDGNHSDHEQSGRIGAALDGADQPDPGPDDGMTQEAALDQLQQNRGQHNSSNGRRHHHNGQGGGGGDRNNGGPRRSRHGGGHNPNGGRRSSGGSHGGPLRGGIPQNNRPRRDEDSGNSAAPAPESNGSDWQGGGESEE